MAKKGTIGAKIVLEGEAQYRQSLKNIKAAQAELRSELKLSQSQFKGNANSMQALTAKQSVLSRQIEQSGKKVDVYTTAVEKTTKKQEEAKRILDELKASQNASDEEIQKAQKDYDNITAKLSQYQTGLNYAEAELNEFKAELSKTEGYMGEASRSMDGCATSIDEFGNELKDTEGDVTRFGDVMKANIASEAVISSIRTLVNGIKDIATAAIETGMQFESSMDKVAALSGATGKDLDALTEKAKDMGANTMFSASEAADAFGYMALAGWKTGEMLEGIEPILSLAAAANMDLATTSDIVTDYLTAFGLSASDAADFSDKLAYAMANSNTNVEQLGEAYKNCASTANSLGYSVDDVTAVLMTMANAGIKGGEAGTGLSSIMTRLATNTKGCADTLEEMGVKVYDAEGNMNSLSSILDGLSGAWVNLSQEEQASLAKTIAGVQQFSKFQTIMAGVSESAKEGGSSFYDYSEALSDCTGTAKAMADTMQDNLQGKLTILESTLDALKVTAYEAFDDSLKDGVDGATRALSRLNRSIQSGKLSVSFAKMSDALGDFIKRSVELGEKGLPVVVDGLAWILDNSGLIIAGIGGIVAAQAAMGIAQGINAAVTAWKAFKTANEGATIAQWLLNEAMLANPAGAVVAGITALSAALGGLIYYASTYKEEANEETKALQKLNEETKESNEATREGIKARADAKKNLEAEAEVSMDLVDRLDELQKKTNLTTAEQQEMASIVGQLNTIYPDLNISLDKNGKIVGSTTDEIRKQIKATLDLMKVKAAEGDMAAIATEIYEKEKLLSKSKTELAAKEEAFQKQTGMTVDQWNEYVASIGNGYAAIGMMNSATGQFATEINGMRGTVAQTEGELDALNGEYQAAYNYVTANTSAVSESDEAYKGLEGTLGDTAKAYKGLSAEVQTEMTNLADAVEKSVESSTNAFEKFDKGTKISKKDLIKNLTSQIKGVTDWSKNMQILAKRGVSSGLLEELAKLGPEGSNYVSAFVKMTDEELAGYDSKFQEYLALPSSTGKEIAGSYGDAAKESMGAIETGITEGGENVVKAADNTIARIQGRFEFGLAPSVFKVYGANVSQGIALGINGDPSAPTAARNLARRIQVAFTNELGIHSPSRVFAQFGKYTIEGYVDGIKKNSVDVTKATKRLGSDAIKGIQNELVGSELALSASPLSIDVTHNAGSNNDIVRALGALGNIVKTSNVNNYSINGITYDDGSNIANAIGQLIHAAKVERRM